MNGVVRKLTRVNQNTKMIAATEAIQRKAIERDYEKERAELERKIEEEEAAPDLPGLQRVLCCRCSFGPIYLAVMLRTGGFPPPRRPCPVRTTGTLAVTVCLRRQQKKNRGRHLKNQRV